MITILDNSEHSVIPDEDLSTTVDEAMRIMDYDQDGFIDYWEYIQANLTKKHNEDPAVETDQASDSAPDAAPVPAVNPVPDVNAAPAAQAAPAVVPT